MSDEIIIALIGSASVIITAIIGVFGSISKRLREIERKAHENSIKLETLWAIYAEDAIRSARDNEMIAQRSTAVPTEKWYEITTSDLRSEIEEIVGSIPNGMSPREMAIKVTNELAEELLTVSYEGDVSAASVFGTIYMICVKSKKWINNDQG